MGVAVASNGEEIHLLGHTATIFAELAAAPRWRDTRVAIASCCDLPESAEWLLGAFRVADGSRALGQVVTFVEIRRGSKREHFRRLREASGVAFGGMLFFDDQAGN